MLDVKLAGNYCNFDIQMGLFEICAGLNNWIFFTYVLSVNFFASNNKAFHCRRACITKNKEFLLNR